MLVNRAEQINICVAYARETNKSGNTIQKKHVTLSVIIEHENTVSTILFVAKKGLILFP